MLAHVPAGADVILPMANGEPIELVDELEAHHASLTDVRLHQMHALHERPYIHGAHAPHLRHVSYFLSHATREAYRNGTCDLVPNHFSEVPALLRSSTRCSLVIAATTPPSTADVGKAGLEPTAGSPLCAGPDLLWLFPMRSFTCLHRRQRNRGRPWQLRIRPCRRGDRSGLLLRS